ncbi:MAG: DUF3179 domain-containing protein [Candidatus Nitrosocosmicus sp.]|nr:DUF3179 domain-containing protein [Candidatus Nitrosocosmicus sp.]
MLRLTRFLVVTISIAIISIVMIIFVLPTNINYFSINSQILDSGIQSFNKSIVPLDQIVSGGPPPDGIPSIDNPQFVSVENAESFMDDSDLVLGVDINGDIRGYPLQILVWHEIVNDIVGETPIAVTYCPLCFTNQIFNRTLLDGQTLELGTSGKLYNSNLVMYDRNTDSLWSQAMAQSIAGELSGTKLERIPFDLATWKDWKLIYPNSKMLSQDTGHARPYGADPYGDYYTNPDILFPVSNNDDNRLGVKEIVIGLEEEEENRISKAYKLKDIEELKIINDKLTENYAVTLWSTYPYMVRLFDPSLDGKETLLTFHYDERKHVFIDNQTGSEWNFEGKSTSGQLNGSSLSRLPFDQGFWFEWSTFHPDTKVYTR